MIIQVFGYVIHLEIFKVNRKTGRFKRSHQGKRCLVAHDGHFFLLVDPEGKILPGQTDLSIYSPLNEPSYAVVTLQINGIHQMKGLYEETEKQLKDAD